MTKQEFFLSLQNRLSHLPQAEVEERLTFYNEMIDDRMEEGLSEEDAVAAVGTIDETAGDLPSPPIQKPAKKWQAWEILLLVLGSPVWLSLLIAALAVVFSLYVSLWSVIVSLWAVFGSVAGCALGCILGGIGFLVGINIPAGVAMIGGGIVCVGVSILLFLGCKTATSGTVLLTKKCLLTVKNRFGKKEDAQ